MKSFNKILMLVLVGALLFGFIPDSKAQSSDTILLSQPLLDNTMYISSIAAHQGALYIKANSGLYRYTPGDDDAVLLLENSEIFSEADEELGNMDLLLSDGETLYAMNHYLGMLRPILIQDDAVTFGETKQFDWSSFFVEEDDFSYSRTPENVVLSDGFLYLLSYDERDWMTPVRMSLDSGEVEIFEDLQFIKKLASYKDGKLLAMLYDEQTAYDQQTGQQKPPDLAIFDPQESTLDIIGPLKEGMQNYWSTAMIYDAAEDKLYFNDNNVIYYRQALGDAIACAILPAELGYTGTPLLHVLESGRLAALTLSGIALREDSPEKFSSTKTVVIAGYSDEEILNRISAQMPDVRLDWQSVNYYDNQDLVQAMLSRSADADIFVLNTGMHQVSSFIKKGYTLELPADGEAAKATAAMYPRISELAMIEDKIFALPISFEFSVSMVQADLFEKIGLPVPEDFFAICDVLQAWAHETHENYPEYTFWMGFDSKNELYDMAFEVYKNSLRAKGEDLRFDTELFRSMMARIEKMDTQAIDVDIDWEDPASYSAQDEFFNKTPLIDRGYGFSPYMVHQSYQSGKSREIAVFAAEPDAPKVTDAYVSLLAVNPFSKNPEDALRFIDLYAASLPAMTRVMLMPEENEPILNPRYDEEIAWTNEYITMLQEQVKDNKAKSEPVSELEADVLMLQESLKDAEITIRYLLTKDDISLMRKIIDMVYVPTSMHNLEDQADLYTAFYQFKEGTISLEQFIKESDSKLRLVRLENQ